MWFSILLLPLALATPPIRCVNFYGFENDRKAPVCNWQHEPKWYLQTLKDGYGLNAVRLPYSREFAIGNNFKLMDDFIKTCNDMDIKVILDYHRTYSTHQGKGPTEGTTLGQFLDTHIGLLNRYQGQIWGVSAFNEIQSSDSNYTNQINHMVVNAIESQFPNTYNYFLGCANWGHDCSQITIPEGFENRSFVDIHQYAFTDNQTSRNTYFPSRIPSDRYFVGEIGCKDNEIPWLKSYLEYLDSRRVGNLCFWTIAHSPDTGGLWKDDCETLNVNKVDLLADFFNVTNRYRSPCARYLRGEL